MLNEIASFGHRLIDSVISIFETDSVTIKTNHSVWNNVGVARNISSGGLRLVPLLGALRSFMAPYCLRPF